MGKGLNSPAPTTSFLVGGVFNIVAPAPVDGQECALQLDANGNLLVNVASGVSGTQYTAGTTVPTPIGTVALGQTPAGVLEPLPLNSSGEVVVGGTVFAPTFSRGGTVLNPNAPVTVVVWDAPFGCTVTNVKGYISGATGSTINALKNASTLLASDLTLGSLNTWLDGGTVQNASFVIGDTLAIQITGVTGAPTQIVIQINFTRP